MASERTWSVQQNAIFAFFLNALGHLIVRARAGTGKTTTIVEAVKRYKQRFPAARVVLCAFNARIADELVTRFVGYLGVEVKTLHALGRSIVKKYWPSVRVEDADHRGLRAAGLTDAACGPEAPDAIKKLVTRLHTLGREICPHATRGGDLYDLAVTHGCEPDEEWGDEGWTTEQVCDLAALAMHAAAKKPADGMIDFSDMIFLPVRNRWLHQWADLVVVDEAQDMTTAQLEIAQGICRGRIVVVGDDRQAIYGFRGADSGSLDRLKRELGAEELGLTITYRCGRAIVFAAQRFVPDFEAGPTNPEGTVESLANERLLAEAAQPGDFVLSRMNAPLVAAAMKLLRAGKRARIAGRNVGADLQTLVRKLTKSARSVPEFLKRLAAWEEKEIARAIAKLKSEEARDKRVEEIADKAEMLRSLADDADSVEHVKQRIEALFTDDGLGQANLITCSSVHRAKGLEADRVFILSETLRDHTIEEQNIEYVAITRAKRNLVWVGGARSLLTVARTEQTYA